jgi:hypothetical protein
MNVAAFKAAAEAGLSDHTIAQVLHMHPEAVRRHRHQLEAQCIVPPISERIGRDGKLYRVAAIGKRGRNGYTGPALVPEAHPCRENAIAGTCARAAGIVAMLGDVNAGECR